MLILYFELFPNQLLGIFQFETPAVQKILKHITSRNLKELCALNSLNRPATKELVEEYVDGRNNGNMKYDHPIIKEVLDDTYGVMLYQEQVMELANKLGKIPLGETDNFRKALVKYTDSKKDVQEEIRKSTLSKFISGGEANLDDGEIAGILVDRDNAQMKIYIDDSLYATISSVTAEPIFPFGLVFANSGTCKLQFNFGNPIHSISSGNTDPGGYGNFEFSTKL